MNIENYQYFDSLDMIIQYLESNNINKDEFINAIKETQKKGHSIISLTKLQQFECLIREYQSYYKAATEYINDIKQSGKYNDQLYGNLIMAQDSLDWELGREKRNN